MDQFRRMQQLAGIEPLNEGKVVVANFGNKGVYVGYVGDNSMSEERWKQLNVPVLAKRQNPEVARIAGSTPFQEIDIKFITNIKDEKSSASIQKQERLDIPEGLLDMKKNQNREETKIEVLLNADPKNMPAPMLRLRAQLRDKYGLQ